jgi:GT2 family glycosyltransferase
MTFVPIRILIIDIDHPLPHLSSQNDPSLANYTQARILVRLHNQPLGMIDLDLPQTAAELAQKIWVSFEKELQAHLAQDGILQTNPLGPTGLEGSSIPACLQKQNELLTTAPFVSIVIATRDRVASLQECLNSIFTLDYSNYEVIIVDNAPQSSETADYINSAFANSSNVRYLREDTPGLAIAHNRAMSEVKAPIVVFTDDDVLVDAAWLKSIVAVFQQDPQVGCVTGMILPYEIETPPQLWIEQFGGFGKGYQQKTFDMKENRPPDFLFPYSAGKFGSGANMAFRTSVLAAIGWFDPALGAGTLAKGGDDLAVFFDIITHGYRLTYEPRAILSHKHRRDYPGLARQAHGYGVGLSAFLTKTILDRPTRLIDVLFKVPAGLKHILDPNSPKNRKKLADYPHELTQLEQKGFLMGPLAYIRSRWKVRSVNRP